MKNTIRFVVIAMVFASSLEVSFAGYDESRPMLKKTRAEGEAWSELKRPEGEHLHWEEFEFEVWQDTIHAPAEEKDENVIAEDGGLNGKWQKDILGDRIAKPLTPNPHDPEQRWSEMNVPDFEQDTLSTEGIRDISRSRMDPGWHQGSYYDWEAAAPGLNQEDRLTVMTPRTGMSWNDGMPAWENTMTEEKNRPMRHV